MYTKLLEQIHLLGRLFRQLPHARRTCCGQQQQQHQFYFKEHSLQKKLPVDNVQRVRIPGAPAGFKNVDAQPVGSGASLREMIRNIDNYFAIG